MKWSSKELRKKEITVWVWLGDSESWRGKICSTLIKRNLQRRYNMYMYKHVVHIKQGFATFHAYSDCHMHVYMPYACILWFTRTFLLTARPTAMDTLFWISGCKTLQGAGMGKTPHASSDVCVSTCWWVSEHWGLPLGHGSSLAALQTFRLEVKHTTTLALDTICMSERLYMECVRM